MLKLDTGIWTVDGDPIRFLGFPYELRSTIVDLGGGSLFVVSPVQWSAAAHAVESLGHVDHIVSPNKLHHLFLPEWSAAFPAARLYAPPGLGSKRPDLSFDGSLGDQPEPVWASILKQRVVRGSFFMEEVVFFHQPSGILIVGDLIENHDPAGLRWWRRVLARANGMLAPNGSTPRNYRFTFWRRAEARRAIEEVLSWEPRRLVVAHGPCIERNTTEFLRRAFRWLL